VGGLVRFGVSLENDLLSAFDELCRKRGHASRSEALRRCIRQELAEEHAADPLMPTAGVLTLVYNHHDSDLPRRLTAIQHEAHESVTATLHVHLDSHHCLEVMALRGAGGEVRALADRLRSAKGVLQSSLSLVSMRHEGDGAHEGERA
jgi:CopG family nickel-responsive transcriptional regulator